MGTTRDLLIGYFLTLKSPSPDRDPDEVAAGWADDVLRIVPVGPGRVSPTFTLTPEEAASVLDWYYSASDDFIPDDQDRELVRRLDTFAHDHGMKGF